MAGLLLGSRARLHLSLPAPCLGSCIHLSPQSISSPYCLPLLPPSLQPHHPFHTDSSSPSLTAFSSPFYTHAFWCCCYATPLSISLRNVSYSSRIQMSEATMGRPSIRHMLDVHVHLFEKRTCSFVNVFLLLNLIRCPLGDAAACQWVKVKRHVIKFKFISYAWYKIQLGHITSFACILYMVRTLEIHVYTKRN